MKVAVVGATGLVGTMMCRILEERNFPVTELIPVTSPRSAGSKIEFGNQKIRTVLIPKALSRKPDIALFSAGGPVSLEAAPLFVKQHCVVIDNSSAWRMNPEVPLVVPEINAGSITKEHRLISNPNCSTVQLVMVVSPLHQRFKIRRMVVSTYQSVTGTGKKAVDQLMNERNGVKGELAYNWPIDLNVIPQIDSFLDNGYTKEEMKIVNETRKILRDDSIQITATAVRVPVIGGHSESVNVEFENNFEVEEVLQILAETKGVVVIDNPVAHRYPMPVFSYHKDEVFVGRIRRDESCSKALNLWIVADNLRKGAATNAVQIAEYIIRL
ncbi:MAG: aspartate-semialdehyde dehydrogenase [Bacteroidia bacterium]|nr:aspartate-semialdehyde dehydrogenase [Bacteroidia bacterium]MCZ2278482.1 aspartate-semialdehyde dehydrogenase [Bacteroidia bacterium]